MNEEILKRLADALEGVNANLEGIGNSLADISASLENLEKDLDGCVSRVGDNQFLCITGNVTTY